MRVSEIKREDAYLVREEFNEKLFYNSGGIIIMNVQQVCAVNGNRLVHRIAPDVRTNMRGNREGG